MAAVDNYRNDLNRWWAGFALYASQKGWRLDSADLLRVSQFQASVQSLRQAEAQEARNRSRPR